MGSLKLLLERRQEVFLTLEDPDVQGDRFLGQDREGRREHGQCREQDG